MVWGKGGFSCKGILACGGGFGCCGVEFFFFFTAFFCLK